MDSTDLHLSPKSNDMESSSSKAFVIAEKNDEETLEDTENDQNLINITNAKNLIVADNPVKSLELSPKSHVETENSPKTSEVVDRNSDSENETELTFNKSSKRGKFRAIFDSDSEGEEGQGKVNTEEKIAKLLSDNDNEKGDELNKTSKTKSSKIAVIDSDSDEEITSFEDFVAKRNRKTNGENETENKTPEIFVFNKQGDLIAEEEKQPENRKKILSNLCDEESSDADSSNEEPKEEAISEDELRSLQSVEPLKSRKRKPAKAKDAEDPEKMTAKKALEQRKEILAESQRRVRESRLSLPYHKPKARSLKEFLQNRPKLASPLCDISQGQSPAAAIKMSLEQLELVSQKLKEREKEVEKFYKSDTESEDEKVDDSDTQVVNSEEPIVADTNQDIDTDVVSIHDPNENKELTEKTDETIMETVAEEVLGSENVQEKISWEQAEKADEASDSNIEKSDELEALDSKEQDNLLNKICDEINQNEEIEAHDALAASEGGGENVTTEKPIIISNILINKPENFYNLEEENKEDKDMSNSYEFNLDDIEDESENNVNETQLKRQKKIEILQKFTPFKPKLSGGPDQVIDLENGITLPDEITKLRERFLQHNSKIGKNKHKKQISILRVNDGEIKKETLSVNMDEEDEENTAPIEKPGVRFQKLRVELEHQMAQRRSDLWKEKLNQKNNEIENENFEEKILDDEEEEEMTESEEDEELEENDCDMTEKKRKKSAFVEEEAEESELEEDDEGINEDNDDDRNEEDMNEDNDKEEEQDEDSEQNEEDEVNDTQDVPKKKVLKRIIKPFDEDDDSDNEERTNKSLGLAYEKKMEKTTSFDEIFPPHQPSNYKIGGVVLTPTKSDSDFCTPVTYMTGLQNLNKSGTKNTPSKLFNLEDSFADNSFTEKIDTKSQDEELEKAESNALSTQDVLEICSGKFPSSSGISSPEISTQQLADIFDTNDLSNGFKTQDLVDICSGQFTGITQAKPTENILDENDEQLISQLIDEEELERFKKKFESPLDSNTQKTIDFEAREPEGGGVIDSDDENTELTLKRKKRKRLTFSDDEDSEASNLSVEETIDLQDNEAEDDEVEYDSEENEIDANEKIDVDKNLREMVKANEFFENEAELSESEWGSEDEDERNLDDMEFEKGDEEKFDDDELRTDIERIQMRQMLDEDNREVKLLQELLLEDGELHGSGRQRQFRWKNIDDAGQEQEGEVTEDDGTVYLDDEESEEQWRKMRHEREMFMMKKQSQTNDDNLVIETKLSFTKTLKIKSQTSVTSQNNTPKEIPAVKIKHPLSLMNKRGSFLSRSEQILQKFAETTKVSLSTKTVNRIVFQSDDKKRKATSTPSDSTPLALKKIRLSGFSPALQEKKSKKSLFGELSIE